MEDVSTLVGALRARGDKTPAHIAFRHLHDDDSTETVITYAELERRARAIGAELQRSYSPGSRALLVYQHDLEFVVGFFGCLFGGLVAVPVMPPDRARLDRTLPRFLSAVRDADVSVVLSTTTISAMRAMVEAVAPDLAPVPWLTTDAVDIARADEWTPFEVEPSSLAFFHYTSGSTANPKGVMVSHSNVFANMAMIGHFGNVDDQSHLVSWIPFYHSIGLILAVLGPVVLGFPSTFLSPFAFLQQPARWLRAIHRYRATATAAPNFAYDLCTRAIGAEERADLDLSCLEFAINGAEPIHPEVLENFSATFAECGLKGDVFALAYGMAENVLLNSMGARPWVVHELDADVLTEGRAETATPASRAIRRLVSCGRTGDGHRIVVVNPDTHRPCSEGEVGEVWLSGPSVTLGYWRKPEETEQTFGGYLADTGEGPFLRSGDLGFLKDGDLCLTGRLKELIIVRGANHYPQDIERTVERAHPAIVVGQGAAFSVDVNGSEELVIGYEADLSSVEADEVFSAIRRAVTQEHGLRVHAIAILKAGTMPKTAVGKRQRRALRDEFVAQSLDAQVVWMANDAATPVATTTRTQSWDHASIVEILRRGVADAVGLAAVEIDPQQPFASYGLDSQSAVALSASVGAKFGLKLKATMAYDYPTLEKLGSHIAELVGVSREGRREAPEATRAAKETSPIEGRFSPIAIVGIGCRVPGAAGPRAFWSQLCEGLDAIGDVPKSRSNARAFWNGEGLDHERTGGRLGGFIEDVDRFDHEFFGISMREATRMDPQQRLLLEVCWEAFEDAGIRPSSVAGTSTGVFVGIATNDYAALQLQNRSLLDPFVTTGNAASIAANRLSYFFDLNGPSVAVDSACSSSLVALHLACTSLWMGDCTAAISGGVNLILTETTTANLVKAGMLAQDGYCRPFDANASGYVRGEGAGVVVLKTLSQAIADGDRIYAVIRGTAVNQDGRTNGLIAPNGKAQEAVLRAAYERAGVAPASVQYVEAQGTGTRLGDPIEAAALEAVLCDGRPDGEPLLVGSVKANVGHLEAAAGMAALVKAALATHHARLPKTLHFRDLNPLINDEKIRIVSTLSEWPRPEKSRIAGVSAFGFGGTNAHAVLEQAPAPTSPAVASERPAYLLVLSARTKGALVDSAKMYAEALSEGGSLARVALGDVCAAAMGRREALPKRAAFVAASREELVTKLRAYAETDARSDSTGTAAERSDAGAAGAKVGFVFSGQKSKDIVRARELFEGQSVFREAFRAFDAKRGAFSSVSLEEALFSRSDDYTENAEVIQPLLVGIQVALWALWSSWGIEPDVVVGHGLGEISAAYAAGIISLDDAARIAVLRGRLTRRASLGDPTEPLAAELAELLVGLGTSEPAMTMYSTVTGERVTMSLDGAYWAKNLRDTARFADVVATMAKEGVRVVVQLGPHPVLDTEIQECASASQVSMVVLPSLHEERPALETMLASVGALFERGRVPNATTLHSHVPHVEGLPTYPWQRVRCWISEEAVTTSPLEEWGMSLSDENAERTTGASPTSSTSAGTRASFLALRGASRSEMTTTVVEYLTKLVAKTLAVSPADIVQDTRLDELGVESIMLMELHQSVHRDLGTDLPLSVLYDRPTLIELAEHISALMIEHAA
ncbi:MAG TPA: beta-ketoacyl synthase N-terminal-like domain-containing protein [Labilithrix sp.]|nr:beta-ketoacyl synthase N-terminal-like domain-containing protein [Labilithrix sp.]